MSVTTIKPDQTDGSGDDVVEEKKGGKKKLVVIAVALLLVAAAGYWFLLRPSGPTEPEPGEILPLESTQINLASGHYLKLGIALQLVAGAEEVDGSKALDAAIDLFSGRSINEVSKAADRKHLKEKLNTELEEAYEGEVMSVYFTEFVTQ
jgi:flagellar FliL protein